MSFVDLNAFPVSGLPGQAVGVKLTLADVLRFCASSPEVKPLTWLRTSRILTAGERAALVKLAYHGAELRNTKTIQGKTLDEMLTAGGQVCPLTLTVKEPQTIVEEGYILAPLDEYNCPEVSATDFFAQMVGLLPFDLWGREREKGRLSNFLLANESLATPMACHQGTFGPTAKLLCQLIVELENRIASAIRSAGQDGTWELSLQFGESTAYTQVEVDEPGGQAKVLHAHEFEWRGFGLGGHLEVHHDALPHGYGSHCQVGKDYRPPLPTIASLVSPAAAVFRFVFLAHHNDVQLDIGRYWRLALYFCKLCLVTSGRDFAAVLESRPERSRRDHLPELDAEVESCAHQHESDDRRSRKLPAFEGPIAERTRKRTRDDIEEGSHAEATSKKGEEEDYGTEELRSAVRDYDAAMNKHTTLLVENFDEGRGFDLLEVLRDWGALDCTIGEDKAGELLAVRTKIGKAQEKITACVKKIVEDNMSQQKEEEERRQQEGRKQSDEADK